MPNSDSRTFATPPASKPRCTFDPNAGMGAGCMIVQEAGFGSLDALRILMNVSMESALNKKADDPYAVVAAAEAINFARLCAAHRMPLDVRALAGALCLTSDRLRRIGFEAPADDMMGESIAILERLADDGDDVAAFASGQLVALHPGTVEIAKSLLSATEE